MPYNLSFISDQDLYYHVKDTVLQYRNTINLAAFNKNIIDPVKLTFDSKVYGKTIDEIVDEECKRQIDKTNSNIIGYFHQNIFHYIGGNEWVVPQRGFDIINPNRKIFVEMKNKHNTMNSSSIRATSNKMLDKIDEDPDNICLLVEVIAKDSQYIQWGRYHPNIKRVSIDKFYEMVTGEQHAFYNLLDILPIVIDDVIREIGTHQINNTVFEELSRFGNNTLNSLNNFAFSRYQGF